MSGHVSKLLAETFLSNPPPSPAHSRGLLAHLTTQIADPLPYIVAAAAVVDFWTFDGENGSAGRLRLQWRDPSFLVAVAEGAWRLGV